MNNASFALRRRCVRTGVLFAFFLMTASFSLAQNMTYNGYTVVADELLIRLKTPDAAAAARVQAAMPAAVFENLSPSLGIHRVRVPGLSFQVWRGVLEKHPDVLYAEPNYIVKGDNTPNDANYPLLYGMVKISAPSAWNSSTGNTSMVLGIVDSGIDYNHPDLAANVWSAPASFSVTIANRHITCAAGSHGYNAITRTCDPADDNNHGTHVSGTVGAVGNNSIGVAGVNWSAQMMGLKFLDSTGSGSTSNAINAIEFAIQAKAAFAGTATPVNVRVLSNSWGGGGYSSSLLAEINKANSNDMLFVAAAGNSGVNTDTTPNYPSSYTAPNVVSVAATDSTDTLASFSNYGAASVDLAAPGVSVYSTIPGGNYASYSGTSMATPHVSGAALLVLSVCPSLNTAALKDALLNNVDAVAGLAGNTVTGGRLNVYRAMNSCAAPPPPPVPTSLAAYSGTPQSTTVGTSFPSALQARVTDQFSNPMSGVNVTFTAPGSGASATFSGINSASAITNASGIATSPVPMANATAGSYNVTASVSGLTAVNFSLTNTPVSSSTGNTIFAGSGTPASFNMGTSPVETGMRFRSDVAGNVTGARFYKVPGDTTTHTASLWTSTGTQLATGTFSGETSSGWQSLTFSSPVAIAANTTYVVSYHTGGPFAVTVNGFQNAGVDNAPLHALKDGLDGPDGVYAYGGGGTFPAQGYQSSNYWVDVVVDTGGGGSGGTPQSIVSYSGTPQSATVGTAFGSALQARVTDGSANPLAGISVTFTAPASGASATFNGSNSVIAVTNASGVATSLVPVANSTAGSYNVTAAVSGLSPANFSLTNNPSGPPPASISIFPANSTPAAFETTDPVEVGMRFRSDVSGVITGIKFYKAPGDTTVHSGTLWRSDGTAMATGTFTNETASGWQTLTFSTPVAIAANTTYIASYHSGGPFAKTLRFFESGGATNGPLHALQDGFDGPNGVYVHSGGGVFPTGTYFSTNYWVDVVFSSN